MDTKERFITASEGVAHGFDSFLVGEAFVELFKQDDRVRLYHEKKYNDVSNVI